MSHILPPAQHQSRLRSQEARSEPGEGELGGQVPEPRCSAPLPPLLIQKVLSQACLLLAPPRGLREPKAPPVLLQVLYAKDLVVVAQHARDLE